MPGDLTAVANGIVIANLIGEVPTEIVLPVPKERSPIDFAKENEQARENRARAAAALVPKTGRRLRSLSLELEFLRQTTQELNELATLVQQGHHHHAHGCITIFRALIASGGRNFQPLASAIARRCRASSDSDRNSRSTSLRAKRKSPALLSPALAPILVMQKRDQDDDWNWYPDQPKKN
jgi:hypothetical protein